MLTSTINDPRSWDTSFSSMKVEGAETLMFIKFDDRTDVVAEAKGKTFWQTIGLDGPLAAAGRLATMIQREFEFGKRRRLFRAKRNSILARSRQWP